MKQFFVNLLARLKGVHAVDHVVASFHSALAKLEAVEAHHEYLHDFHEKVAREAEELRLKAGYEADRARQIAQRFRELLK